MKLIVTAAPPVIQPKLFHIELDQNEVDEILRTYTILHPSSSTFISLVSQLRHYEAQK